ncbi:MAG: hypothetical protein QM658_04175 [Gordonia sp. (in: high G+C Gram-positive bacteria)]
MFTAKSGSRSSSPHQAADELSPLPIVESAGACRPAMPTTGFPSPSCAHRRRLLTPRLRDPTAEV